MTTISDTTGRIGTRWASVTRFGYSYGIVAALLILIVCATVLYPGFLAPANIINLLHQNAAVGLIAIGMTFVIISGGFDLSVGSTYALSSVTFAGSMLASGNVVVATLAALLTGLVCGLINGVLIAYFQINPFIVTLGTLSVFSGAAYLISASTPFVVRDPAFRVFATSNVLGVPLSIIVLVIVFALAGVVLAKTSYGRNIYAVGGNSQASWLSGIRVKRTSASVYVVVGALAATGAAFDSSRLGVGQANIGGAIALDAIAIVVVGGTALIGGEGAVWRSAIGLLILATLTNLFYSLNVDQQWQLITKGVIVIAAVGLDGVLRRRR